MESTPTPPFDVLFAHRRFVEATVRAVLGGDPEADDVVQDTWMRALEGGPARPRAVRSWLGRVARNLALDRWRRRARRRRRENAVARCEAMPSVHAIAEREEARRALIDALLALDEPYRAVVLLRYYEDLSLADVALRLDLPTETVKTRLRRGLVRLRERLGTSRGTGRGPWTVALTTWWCPATAVGRAALGGLVMRKVAAVVAALLVIGIAATVVPWGADADRRGGSPPPPRSVSGAGSNSAEAAPQTPVEGPKQAALRAAIVLPIPTPPSSLPDPGPAAPRPPEGAPAPRPRPFAAGVVVDTQGKPVAGAAIVARTRELLPWGRRQDGPIDFVEAATKPTARTDKEGRFSIDARVRDLVSLVVVADGFAFSETRGLDSAAEANQDLRLVVGTGRRFVGTVRDRQGRALEGALAWVTFSAPSGPVLFGYFRADADGRFVVAFVPDGPRALYQVSVGIDGYARDERNAPIADTVDFVLRRTKPVFHVTDAETGRPLEGAAGILFDSASAQVGVLVTKDPRTGTPRPGRGVVTPLDWPPRVGGTPAASGSFRATLLAPGHLPREIRFEIDASTEPPRVDVALDAGTPPPSLAGRVDPAEGAVVEVHLTVPKGHNLDAWTEVSLASASVDGDGSFAIGGLPAGAYRVHVSAPGCAPEIRPVTVPDAALRVTLTAEAILEVRTLGANGQPESRWVTVGLAEKSPTRRLSTQMSDADGFAEFRGLPAGDAHVVPLQFWDSSSLATLPAHPVVMLAPGDWKTAEVRAPQRIQVTLKAVGEDGRPLAGLDVGLFIGGPGWSPWIDGPGHKLSARRWKTDANGLVRVDLYAGAYLAETILAGVRQSTPFQVVDSHVDVALAPTR